MMTTIKPAIVVVAYKRANALRRLLGSIARADFPAVADLIISLEGGASEDVVQVARSFCHHQLHVKLLQHKHRLGLKNHIISCGDLSAVYGAVIILEEDLLVDKYFYRYSQCAANWYDRDESTAAVALYAYERNEFIGIPFTPVYNGYDTYPMQVACSWGQCWTARQWGEFKEWLGSVEIASEIQKVDMPQAVKLWGDSSWKKMFAAYLVAKKKFTIFPYRSFTTNCSDVGGLHLSRGTNVHHVSLGSQSRPLTDFLFCESYDADVAYDSYMEQSGEMIFRELGLGRSQVVIDLHGTKPISLLSKFEYAVTPRRARRIIRSFPRSYRPIEKNINEINEEERGDIFLIRTDSLLDSSMERIWREGDFCYYTRMEIVRPKPIAAIARCAAVKALRKLKESLSRFLPGPNKY